MDKYVKNNKIMINNNSKIINRLSVCGKSFFIVFQLQAHFSLPNKNFVMYSKKCIVGPQTEIDTYSEPKNGI